MLVIKYVLTTLLVMGSVFFTIIGWKVPSGDYAVDPIKAHPLPFASWLLLQLLVSFSPVLVLGPRWWSMNTGIRVLMIFVVYGALGIQGVKLGWEISGFPW